MQSTIPKVSVIIVNWNTRDLLVRCLESLIRDQGDFLHEIIVVDNASSDGSVAAVRQCFPRVNLLESPVNLGFAKANNLAIQQASGDYFCFINSDIEVLEDCLQRLLDRLRNEGRVGIIAPKLVNRDGSFQLSCKRFPTLWNQFCMAVGLHLLFPRHSLFCGTEMTDLEPDCPREVEAVVGAFWLVPREALMSVGLLDERFFFYGEDIDWCRRFHARGWKVLYYPAARAVHYGGASSAKNHVRFERELQVAKLQYWQKHKPAVVLWTYVLLSLLHQTARFVVASCGLVRKPSARDVAIKSLKARMACIAWLLRGRGKPSRGMS